MIGKRHKENIDKIDRLKEYSLVDAISILKKMKLTKFDESVDIAVNLGVDPKHADQLIRGTVSLPNGSGKTVKVLVITKDSDKIKVANDAGADFSGFDEYIEKINNGWTNFDVMVATPDMMPEIGKLGKVLGPRGLMPNPKSGTVTNDVDKAVKEIKAGKVEFRVEKNGIIHVSVGKLSFDNDKIEQNIRACMSVILKARPTSVKGIFFKKFSVSSTMGPAIKIDKTTFIS